MDKATCDILGQVLQAGFDDSVTGPDFPGDSLRLFIDLPGNGRLLAAQDILVGSRHHSILINRELKEHVGITLFLWSQSPHSERQPLWLLTSGRWRGRRRLCTRFVGQGDRLLRVLFRGRFRLSIYINFVSLVNDIYPVIVDGRLVGRVVIRVNRQEGPSRGQRSAAPPPPGIASVVPTSVPTTISPPVIVKIAVKIVLDVVVDLKRPVVAKILDVVLVIAPVPLVKAVGHVLVVAEIADIAPIVVPIGPKVIELPLI